jgi:hypothetical protein
MTMADELIRALGKIADIARRNFGRQAEKLADIEPIARAALAAWNRRAPDPNTTALRARVKELEEGLAPFSAMAGELFARNYNLNDVVLEFGDKLGPKTTLSFREFNVVRTLLKGGHHDRLS